MLAVLAGSRLLVPVVALLGEVEYDDAGLAHDKSSDMATVLLTAPDGRRALLAFSGTDAMRAWDPEARPRAGGGAARRRNSGAGERRRARGRRRERAHAHA